MEIEQLRKEFNQLLVKINNHSERFTDEDHLPSLEVSVMISKINKLQEVAAVLKYATENMEDRANQQRRNYDAQLNVERLEAAQKDAIDLNKETEKKEDFVEVVATEENIIVQEEILIEEPVESTHEVQNETNSSVGDKFLKTPIASLKDAFSLNDRYLFANELFNKNMALFNEVITEIDNCSSSDEANSIFNKMCEELSWDMENENVLSLQNKVQRRFL